MVSTLKRSTFLTALVLALAVLATACGSSDGGATGTHDQGGAEVELAPGFVVPTPGDSTFSLDDHLSNDGRPVFLNLWASWCFPCREEMPAIDAASLRHPEVAFIGVSVRDRRSDAESFLEEIGISYLIGFDDEDAVDIAYQPLGLPASYIISNEGVILERIFGVVTEEVLAEKFAMYFG
jgi:thiol-disulfide isomerase/thioredoxin